MVWAFGIGKSFGLRISTLSYTKTDLSTRLPIVRSRPHRPRRWYKLCGRNPGDATESGRCHAANGANAEARIWSLRHQCNNAMRIFVLTTIWLAAASGVAESKIKNVLFLISDDLKASVLGVYGDPICETPNIDRLAQEGMVFDRTYCQGTSCAPSRRSFMHSRYEGETEINMGKHFIDNGYFSARVGKIYHMKVPGDIIAGTDGLDIESTWIESYNSPGLRLTPSAIMPA